MPVVVASFYCSFFVVFCLFLVMYCIGLILFFLFYGFSVPNCVSLPLRSINLPITIKNDNDNIIIIMNNN